MVSTPILIKKIGSVTVRLKGPIEALNSPSVTEIVIADIEPRSSAKGIPVNSPEDELKEAQAGIPVMLKVKISPSESFVVGRKFKASPTLISEILPEIVGAEF
jgi:hypothetical protein